MSGTTPAGEEDQQAGRGSVAPWITHVNSLPVEGGSVPLDAEDSEGRSSSALFSEATPLRESTIALEAQDERMCTAEDSEQRTGPIASSSNEVSEIRLGSDFLQTLD